MPKPTRILVSYSHSVTIKRLREIIAENGCTILREHLSQPTVTVEVPFNKEAEYISRFNAIAGLKAFDDVQFNAVRPRY